MKNTICLFDMDGTLTPPRKKAEFEIVKKLKELSQFATIGIVTGSDYDYIMQQCDVLMEVGGVPLDKLELFPCNGTKHYTYSGSDYNLMSSTNMINVLGQENYNYLIQSLVANQLTISCQLSLPYTGNFFQYRGSMLNWCPIGRQAGDEERSAWCDADAEHGIRENYMKQINKMISRKNLELTVALGGSTSFDIYPKGWDKTYVLRHLEKFDDIYFVGDKCQEGGNDKALYDVLQKSRTSYETHSVDMTISLIDRIINEITGEGEKIA